MSDSIVSIENLEPNNITVDSTLIPNKNSDFTVIIESLGPNTLSIETSFVENVGLVEIERFASPTIEILTGSNLIRISDLPDLPFTKITGNIDVSRIENLDHYLDNYSFDCGTP
jgi:hypothetical protein